MEKMRDPLGGRSWPAQGPPVVRGALLHPLWPGVDPAHHSDEDDQTRHRNGYANSHAYADTDPVTNIGPLPAPLSLDRIKTPDHAGVFILSHEITVARSGLPVVPPRLGCSPRISSGGCQCRSGRPGWPHPPPQCWPADCGNRRRSPCRVAGKWHTTKYRITIRMHKDNCRR